MTFFRRVLTVACLGLSLALCASTLAACGPKSATSSGPNPPGATAKGNSPTLLPGQPSAPTTGGIDSPDGTRVGSGDLLEPPADYAHFEPLPSFTYHHVAPKTKDDITVTPKLFEQQLQVLQSLGYHTVTARQVVDHQTKGTPLPDKPVMITFDDGWRTQYLAAWPLLKKYGFVATFFINPQPIASGYGGYMSRAMVVDLAKSGMDIESHTWRHYAMTRRANITADAFQKKNLTELTRANAWIAKVTGKTPVAICYPYGYYDLEAIGMSQRAGYLAGWSVDEGVADARPWDAWQMKRFTINSGETLDSFKRRLLSGPLPVTSIQPAPGTRIQGNTATITVDVSAVPANLTDLHLMGIPPLGPMQIVDRAGKKFAEAPIAGKRVGFHAISMRATGPDGRMYYAAWGLETGDE